MKILAPGTAAPTSAWPALAAGAPPPAVSRGSGKVRPEIGAGP